MFLVLNSSLSVKIKYVFPRDNVLWFCLPVPTKLRDRFPGRTIRQSLETSDPRVAARKAQELESRYRAHFKLMEGDKTMTAGETLKAAQFMADAWGDLDAFVEHVVDPRWYRYLTDRGHPSDVPDDLKDTPHSEYLRPHEEAALRILQKGQARARRLSDAFDMYASTHERAHDEVFVSKVKRDWDGLVELVGDIALDDLNREHGRKYIDSRLASVKTTTVRRSLAHINAVIAVAWREWEVRRDNPFAALKIKGENHDAKDIVVPGTATVRDIHAQFAEDRSSTALLILLQLGTGASVGELSGLAKADLVLTHETPHLKIQEQPWRTLKTDSRPRDVPLVGFSLSAAKAALAKAGDSDALFAEYAKARGNDNASAAVNKRISKWGITSHSFRHWVKDALREVGCTDDVQKAIQGHAGRDIASTYGKGHSLKTKQRWLQAVLDSIAST